MAKRRLYMEKEEEPSLDVSPLIDVAFLLLIYFLVTSTLQPKEGDLGLALPADSPTTSDMKLDPLTISLDESGSISLAGNVIEANPESRDLPALLDALTRYKQTCEATDSTPIVVVAADDESLHQRFTDVINVLSEVKIKNITLTGYSE